MPGASSGSSRGLDNNQESRYASSCKVDRCDDESLVNENLGITGRLLPHVRLSNYAMYGKLAALANPNKHLVLFVIPLFSISFLLDVLFYGLISADQPDFVATNIAAHCRIWH